MTAQPFQIRPCIDRQNARHVHRVTDIQAGDPTMRNGGTKNHGMGCVWQLDILNELSQAGQQSLIFNPMYRCACKFCHGLILPVLN